jgi:hypothetical protein
MPESSNEPSRTYKVRVSILTRFSLAFLRVVNAILVFFSLRKKRKYWGIVYDSVTKQPLDPAIVKIAYIGQTETQTCITDLVGNYGFLAHRGRFKLLAKKTNYLFPSQLVTGERDGIYDNLYHGEFFELADDFEVVGPNIPMDPVQFDWNQKAKFAVVHTHPYRKYLVRKLVAIFFWFGFIMGVIYAWKYYPAIPLPVSAALVVYAMLFLLAFVVSELRLWGKIEQEVFPEGSFLLELQNPLLPGVVFGKTVVQENGKFLLRANKGTYKLVVKYVDKGGNSEVIGEHIVKVASEGVVNQSLFIK